MVLNLYLLSLEADFAINQYFHLHLNHNELKHCKNQHRQLPKDYLIYQHHRQLRFPDKSKLPEASPPPPAAPFSPIYLKNEKCGPSVAVK